MCFECDKLHFIALKAHFTFIVGISIYQKRCSILGGSPDIQSSTITIHYRTSLKCFLLRDSLQYIILRRIIPGQKTPFATQLLRNTDVTMVRSGFGPYHGLRCNDAQSKRISVITTPWAMTDALGLVKFGQAQE